MRKQVKITNEQRLKAIGYIRNYLISFGNPRIQMFLILSILFILGFLCSSSLYKIGIDKMWIRYSITLFISYLLFFVLVRIWTFFILKTIDSNSSQIQDYFSFEQEIEISKTGTKVSYNTMKSISFEDSMSSVNDTTLFDWVFDHEYALLIALFTILVISLLFLFGYVIFIAPMFFSEILFEILIISIVYKKIQNYQIVEWYEVVFFRTILPFSLVLVVFTLTAYFIQRILPEIHTIKDVLVIIKNH